MNNSLLEHHSEEELWAAYKRQKDPLIRESFIKQYAPLVKYVAGKVAANMPASVEFDDLVGFGVFGLIDAIDKFDPDKNVKFKTYAVTRIRGAIFDELRSIDWVPRSVRQKTKEIEEAIIATEAKLGRPATDQEIAETLGLSEDEFSKTMLKISSTSVLSLNDLWYTADESEHMTIGDSIESPTSLSPDSIVERDEIRRVVVQAIQELPEKEKKVLVLYYYEELTLKEIGKVLEVTESRISQLHTKAILRLRAKLTHYRKGIV
ncbi:MAG: RNA polymerase sigma factor WhiG [Spirochaetae bacterium HGW-Spirochaetae-7]|jgi:RNA polymerase sigma factor for flagellar operon FliA|nr:MAG: RNA polymerase sigma factor WhiG [Spirochaetae bacterium HGW-Spirochaetae-7]